MSKSPVKIHLLNDFLVSLMNKQFLCLIWYYQLEYMNKQLENMNKQFLCLIWYYPLLFCQWYYPADIWDFFLERLARDFWTITILLAWYPEERSLQALWYSAELSYCFLKCILKQEVFYLKHPLLCNRMASACCTWASSTSKRSLWATKKHLP